MKNTANIVKLPYNYAWDLLDCQIELELAQYVNSKLIFKLMELYELGIDYYISIESKKFEYFKRKKDGITKKHRQITQQKKQCPAAQIDNKKIEYEKLLFNKIQQLHKKSEIKTWMNENQLKMQQLEESVKNQLEKQRTKLQQRLDLRKYKHRHHKLTLSVLSSGTTLRERDIANSNEYLELYSHNKFVYSEEEGL